MPPFRPTEAALAGPTALGILLPPGRRSLVVLRPRALTVDLVLTREEPPGQPLPAFLQLPRGEAAQAAQALGRALLRCAEAGLADVATSPDGAGGLWLWARIEAYPMLVCARRPGEPYRPETFATVEAAEPLAAALRDALCPPLDAERELYTNAKHFSP